MTGPSHIPPHPQAITAGWMTDALASSFPGCVVSSVDVIDQHSGTTGRLRLALTYAEPAGAPDTVFVKLPPFENAQQQLVAMTDMGRKEARFYDELAAEVPMRIPRGYHAAHGERTEYIMVLEDLEASGCRLTNRLEPLADDQSLQLIEGLARLHAHFWDDPRFDTDLSWLQPPMRGALGAQLVDNARQQFADDFPPVFEQLCRLYVEHHEAIAEIWDSGPKTLIHGDCHAGNQFVDDGRVGLYDWAVISRSPGIRDVAIYLGNSCPTDLRRSGQDEWLRAYHHVLTEAEVDPPALEDLWLGYRRTVLYGWVAATTTASMGDTWQPIEVGMAGMTRATHACDDLDTLDALREVL